MEWQIFFLLCNSRSYVFKEQVKLPDNPVYVNYTQSIIFNHYLITTLFQHLMEKNDANFQLQLKNLFNFFFHIIKK